MNINEISPRQRVQLALQHQETDRTPVDFLATPETWANLKKYLGLPTEESIMKYFGVDVRHPRLQYIGPPLPGILMAATKTRGELPGNRPL